MALCFGTNHACTATHQCAEGVRECVWRRRYGLSLQDFVDAAAVCQGGADVVLDRALPRTPCASLPRPRVVGLTWGAGGPFGWGVFGESLLALATAELLFVPLSEVNVEEMAPAAVTRAAPLIVAGRSLTRGVEGAPVDSEATGACPAAPVLLTVAVLHPLGDFVRDARFCNRTWGARGRNAAVIFLESILLPPVAVERLRAYVAHRGAGGSCPVR